MSQFNNKTERKPKITIRHLLKKKERNETTAQLTNNQSNT